MVSVAAGWAWVAAIVWLSLTPSPPQLDVVHSDKLGHYMAYGLLMFWFCQLYPRWAARVAYAAGFMKRYPFIKAEYWRGSGNKLVFRTLTEHRTGQLDTDAVLVGTENAMTQAHAFKAAELCLRAQMAARKIA